MNILFLTDNFPPEVNAPVSRTYEHCKVWIKQGHRITVITCFPNFPIGKVFNGYKNKLYQREVIDGINVIRVWSYIAFNKGFFKRIIDYMSYAFSATIASFFVKDIDVIIATSPQFFTALCGYIGTVGLAHKVIDLIHVAKRMNDDRINDIHILIVGDGANKESIEQSVKNYHLTNVTLTGLIPKNEVIKYFSIVDVVFVILKNTPLFRTVIPSKIFKAAAMDKPIILGVDGEAKEIVLKYSAGIAVEPENVREMYNAVLKLKENSNLYRKLQTGCRELANEYSREILAHKMMEIIEENLTVKG